MRLTILSSLSAVCLRESSIKTRIETIQRLHSYSSGADVSERVPLKQGLKLHSALISLMFCVCLRESSIKTRIETILLKKWNAFRILFFFYKMVFILPSVLESDQVFLNVHHNLPSLPVSKVHLPFQMSA
jgi:hypothetical protein